MERQTEDADLWTMSQWQNKTFQSFIDRFKAVLSKVRGLSDKSAIQALKKSLWYDSDFRKEIVLNALSTIQDAMHRVMEFTVNKEDVNILAAKYGKSKCVNNQPSAMQPQSQPSTKKRNQSAGFVQHEGGFKGAHNYQIESPRFDEG